MKNSALQIAWSRRDITQPLPVGLCGQFHLRIAEKILDPLSLTALAISNDSDSFIWVSCDLVDLPADFHPYCRKLLSAKLPGFDASKLILSATHTHTAPYISSQWHAGTFPPELYSPEAYFEFLAQSVVSAAVEAWQNRSLSQVSYGHSYAVCAHQRRMTYFQDLDEEEQIGEKHQTNAAMYGATNNHNFKGFEGYVDHRIDFLYTYDLKGQMQGCLVALPCPAQVSEGISEISADFWHDVRILLQKDFGENFQLLPLCCAAGDLAPRQQLQKKCEERMLKLQGINNRQAIAQRIVSALKETLQWSQQDKKDSLTLKHYSDKLQLLRRKSSEDEAEKLRRGLQILKSQKEDNMMAESRRIAKIFRTEQALKRHELQKQEKTIQVEHHVLRLGELVFCTFPMEVFLNYALQIQAQSPALATMLIQLTGSGPNPNGYLASENAEKGGGYSACIYCSPISAEGGQQMVKRTTEILNELFANENKN